MTWLYECRSVNHRWSLPRTFVMIGCYLPCLALSIKVGKALNDFFLCTAPSSSRRMFVAVPVGFGLLTITFFSLWIPMLFSQTAPLIWKGKEEARPLSTYRWAFYPVGVLIHLLHP